MPVKTVPFTAASPYMNGDDEALVGADFLVHHVDGPTQPAGTTTGVWGGVAQWEEAKPFSARLHVRADRGDKDKFLLVDRDNKRWYSFFPMDFVEAVQRFGVVEGVLEGQFQFVRKGKSFAIKAL